VITTERNRAYILQKDKEEQQAKRESCKGSTPIWKRPRKRRNVADFAEVVPENSERGRFWRVMLIVIYVQM
jgi:hypothetical protein